MRFVTPPRRMIRWPFSAFATVVMIVFPIFWPILAVMVTLEVFCIVLWLATLIVANLVMLVIAVVAASRRGTRPVRSGS